ncbi:MAG: hypothetical protein ABIJ09_11735 [Pseudomonadota bacterium]
MAKILFIILLTAGTGMAWVGSAYGWGLSSLEKQPVSIRQESAERQRSGRGFLYFGVVGRRHGVGGYRGGK